MNKTLILGLVGVLVVAGAFVVSGQSKSGTNSAEDAPEGSLHNLPVPEAVAAARLKAAQEAGVPEGQAIAMLVEEKQWPNGCLGLAQEGEFCTEAIVPGYYIEVQAGDNLIVYRTNQDGSVIRRER